MQGENSASPFWGCRMSWFKSLNLQQYAAKQVTCSRMMATSSSRPWLVWLKHCLAGSKALPACLFVSQVIHMPSPYTSK
jgi:hypothetical protein